jgi:AraC-like DNA-binding protein
VRAAKDVEGFRADPRGTYVLGKTFLAWCWDETLCGSSLWGRPTEADIRELLPFYDLDWSTSAMAPRFDVVTDASRVESVAPGAFAAVFAYFTRRMPEIAPRIRQNALIVPEGLSGAMIAGMYPLLPASPAWKPFYDAGAGFRWLDRPDAAEVASEVGRIVTASTRSSPVVHALRSYLVEHLAGVTLDDAARALGLSPRSLQRQLAGAATCLRTEIDLVRVQKATRRLIEADVKLESIAAELGFASPSHFTSRFRQLTGETPSEFRARHRLPA